MNRNPYYFLALLLILTLCPWDASAQYNNRGRRNGAQIPESGNIVVLVGVGAAGVKSDICGSIGCNDFGPAVSVGALYKLTPNFGISGTIDYVKLGANEKDARQTRNISFESEVLAFSATAVFNLWDSYAGSGNYRSSRKRFAVPYIRGGVGAVYYTPTSFPGQGNLDDSQTTYDPEREYPAIAAVIPFGGGIRFRINNEFSIAPELMYQITTTDFLDNIGPRLGNPNNKDHYGMAIVKLQYTPVLKNKIFSNKPQSR